MKSKEIVLEKIFYTAYNRPKKVYEINDGEDEVERAGYLTTEQRVENMMRAGERLRESRNYDYQYDPDSRIKKQHLMNADDKLEVSQLRNKAFDLVDATNALREIESRKTEREIKAKELQKTENKESLDTVPAKAVKPPEGD